MSLICSLSKYKNIFGIPSEGVHKYRFLNTAIVDYVLSIVLAAVISYFTDIPWVLTTIIVLSLGILLHMIFGVPTNTLKYLGIKCA